MPQSLQLSSFPLPQVQQELLNWFEENQRPLPWRTHYRPYEVWISEIMLQQTQVKTMLPYYDRWMKALPHPCAVAHASEDQLLKLWEGLGYYSRVKNIHKAAKILCEFHSDSFPEDLEILLKLHGIGRYTAGAILSIAFNKEVPILDGNVIRILCRLMDFRDLPQSSKMQKKLWQLAEEWIPKGKARFFNQAMMELGAIVCTPQAPSCLLCPVNFACLALKNGSVALVPARPVKKKVTVVETSAALVLCDGLILIQKRQGKGLLQGLWEFPGSPIEKANTAEKTLQNLIKEEHGLEIQVQKKLPVHTHRYTSFKANLQGIVYKTAKTSQKNISKKFPEEIREQGDFHEEEAKITRWVSLKELEQYAFSAPQLKLIQMLQQIIKNGDI